MFEVKTASEFDNAEQMTQAAFTLFQEVYHLLPDDPVSIWPRKREHFKPEQTLIAFHQDILGVTVLEPGPDFNGNQLMFRSNAAEILKFNFPDFDIQDLFMISSMAIKPEARGQGIGTALYAKAKELSQGKCIGILYKGNTPGRHLSKKAGFQEISDPTFSHRYVFENNEHILSDDGDRILKWNLFTYMKPQ